MGLLHVPSRPALIPLPQCLISAASNAKNNYDMKKSALYVSTAYADMGPILRRFMPRAQGRGYPIKKPLSHITIVVSEKEQQ